MRAATLRHGIAVKKMRPVLLAMLLLAPALGFAQTKTLSIRALAYDVFKDCVNKKAQAYAPLEGSISEIAAAAVAACREDESSMRKAWSDYYQTMGANSATAGTQAAIIIRGLVSDAAEAALATIAEERLKLR